MRRHLDFIFGVPLLWILRCFTRAGGSPATGRPRRILIIKLAAFGDGIVLIPTLRALRQALPEAQMDWLASPVICPIAEITPYINHVRVLPSFSPIAVLRLCIAIRKVRYDLVIDLEQWSRGSALISWASGAPERLGFAVKGQRRDALYTRSLDKTFTQHERDDFFALVSLAVPLQGRRDLELWESSSGLAELNARVPALLETPRRRTFILLQPGCGGDGWPREWPLQCYAELAKALAAKVPVTFLICGGSDDAEKTSNLAARVPGSVNLGSQLSWKGMISLVKRVDLLVSGNTGVMHVAAAWRTPQVALHGPTDPKLWGPLSDRAIVLSSPCPSCPCLRLGFEYHRLDQDCLSKISVQDVTQAALSLLPPRP